MKAYHSREAGVTARVPQASEASVGSTHDAVKEHAVHRESPLPFAFRAVGFFAYEGQFAVDLADPDVVLMGPVTDAMVNYAVVAPGTLMELP